MNMPLVYNNTGIGVSAVASETTHARRANLEVVFDAAIECVGGAGLLLGADMRDARRALCHPFQ